MRFLIADEFEVILASPEISPVVGAEFTATELD